MVNQRISGPGAESNVLTVLGTTTSSDARALS
jgi:hypothetical protein